MKIKILKGIETTLETKYSGDVKGGDKSASGPAILLQQFRQNRRFFTEPNIIIYDLMGGGYLPGIRLWVRRRPTARRQPRDYGGLRVPSLRFGVSQALA